MNRDPRQGSKFVESAFAGAAPAGAIADQFRAAAALHQRGALAEAERRYRMILAQAPAHADTLHNLGLIALNAGNAASAVDLIEKAIAADSGKAEYHYNIALAWRGLDRPDQVVAHLERTIELRGDYALAHLNLGNVRREQGRLPEAIACYERALALSPNSPAARFNLANMLAELRRWDAAIPHYQQVLKLEPRRAEAYGGLAAALTAAGRPREAIAYLEQALALRPDLAGAYEELAKAYMSAGDVQSAVGAASRALALNETAAGKALFGQCVTFANISEDADGRLRSLVQRALVEAWTVPRDLSNVCVSLIMLDTRVRDTVARVNAAWPARLPAEQLLHSPGLAALSGDQLLHRLLECDPVTDLALERLLASIRCALLQSVTDGDVEAEQLDLYCALARQCFVNEYVYSFTDGELQLAQRLRQSLDAALATEEPIAALIPVVVGAYFPLHSLVNAETLLRRSWPEPVRALMLQQIEEPAQERRIKSMLPALTAIDDEVSRLVRAQYEENPYPRWIKGGPPVQPAILERRPAPVADVLIAGCGTGFFTVGFARKAPQARFLAIDLSLSSLSYAKRMADSFGVTNIEFAQADIMKLGSLGRTFDFIDSSGVLHHMADPWAGWRVLSSLLRPSGVMQVGLYSELARRNVVAARALIAERGFAPVPEDIRRIREIIAAEPDGSLLKSISRWADYFTISECRDLLFHPQEHRTSVPEIKQFLAANDLCFAGFMLNALTADLFVRRYPELANLTDKARFDAFADLDRWHDFETQFPEAFISMYLFWVHKPGARP
jgi:tetratricopeptide (TPR) repeat protein/2-polyprenyl-3-methyl-5-hydroxy-6-metoxy-1,4-benzoquinol methylase